MQETNKIPRLTLNIGITLFVLILATLISFLFEYLGFTNSNIMLLYQLGVLLIAIATSHRIYSLASAIAAVFLFNYFFVYPTFTLNAYEAGYPVTFIVMFLTAFISGTLAVQLKKSSAEREEAAVLIEHERLQTAILRTVSHDLRTPLTSITGHASNLMENEAVLDAETRHRLYSDIYEDAQWLTGMTENLLARTRLENGTELNRSPELIDDLITEAVEHARPTDHKQKVIYEPSEDILMVSADPQLIIQVITNLLNNAFRYTPPESVVTIRTGKEGDRVFVTVEDNGPGISETEPDKLFDAFYIGREKRADGRRGIGLGLSLCRSIIEAHGGTITAGNVSPHGAVFTFTLPAQEVGANE